MSRTESPIRVLCLYTECPTENDPKKHAERYGRYRDDLTLLPLRGDDTHPEKCENAKYERESGGLRLGDGRLILGIGRGRRRVDGRRGQGSRRLLRR